MRKAIGRQPSAISKLTADGQNFCRVCNLVPKLAAGVPKLELGNKLRQQVAPIV
jgi:hypothetical protein